MQPGDVIDGTYEVVEILGEGGMGIVVGARHRTLGTRVAIKLLKPEPSRAQQARDDAAQRFRREARNVVQLRGDHVAHVLYVGRHRGEPYLVMEHLEGHDLDAYQLPLQPRLACELVRQACDGLAEAHALGIVHRDIKPGNLFIVNRRDPLSGAPLVKVIDFGIATEAIGGRTRALTAVHTVLGSPSYMSPEQLASTHDVDGRTDVWSLGVTLYELLAGRMPFEGDTFAEIAIGITDQPHPPLLDVHPALAAIVDRCLAKDPRDRFQSVVELGAALAPFAGVPVAPTYPVAAPTLDDTAPIPVLHAGVRPLAAWGIASIVSGLAIALLVAFALREGSAVAAPPTPPPVIEQTEPTSEVAVRVVAHDPAAPKVTPGRPSSSCTSATAAGHSCKRMRSRLR